MVIIFLVILFLFCWALAHGGTRYNDYFDDLMQTSPGIAGA